MNIRYEYSDKLGILQFAIFHLYFLEQQTQVIV